MKIDRPLINPTPKQVAVKKLEIVEEPARREVHPQSQLEMQIDTNQVKAKQFWHSWRDRIRRRNDFFELNQVWKSPAVPFVLTTFLVNMLIFIIVAATKFSDIGPEIPFFYDSVNSEWVRIDKIALILLPIIYAMIFMILINFTLTIIKSDRKLALAISWIVTSVNILLLITYSQIYFLIT